MFLKTILIVVFLVFSVNCNVANQRQSRFFGWLFGSRCNSCPPHFCENDPAIVLGYCCGCRPIQFQEFLPIVCPPPGALVCPLDGQSLCNDYEYMMECCCS